MEDSNIQVVAAQPQVFYTLLATVSGKTKRKEPVIPNIPNELGNGSEKVLTLKSRVVILENTPQEWGDAA